jgi:hypothetical protein
MSLLLNGSKTATIAGTVMQLVEIYTGESYTFPFSFKTSTGTPINITGWTLSTSVKWYTADITYADNSSPVDVNLIGLKLVSPQPTMSPMPTATITSGSAGTGYLYVPPGINGGQTITIDGVPSLIAIITLSVSRTDAVSGQTDLNKEPIGLIIRYL